MCLGSRKLCNASFFECVFYLHIHSSHHVFISVPTSPPLNPAGVADTSRSLSLSWNPPPPGDQNGMLRHYIVNITEVETGRIIQHTTRGPMTSLQVPLLHPYYTYQWRVSAYTVGEGPYTNVSTLRTPEDGEKNYHYRSPNYGSSNVTIPLGSSFSTQCCSAEFYCSFQCHKS